MELIEIIRREAFEMKTKILKNQRLDQPAGVRSSVRINRILKGSPYQIKSCTETKPTIDKSRIQSAETSLTQQFHHQNDI